MITDLRIFSTYQYYLLTGLLVFVIRSLLCQSLENAGGRVVLVTGCDTGIGHEVITSH